MHNGGVRGLFLLLATSVPICVPPEPAKQQTAPEPALPTAPAPPPPAAPKPPAPTANEEPSPAAPPKKASRPPDPPQEDQPGVEFDDCNCDCKEPSTPSRPSGRGDPSVEGELRFDGHPAGAAVSAKPRFFFSREGWREPVRPRTEASGERYAVFGLRPGKYFMSVAFEAAGKWGRTRLRGIAGSARFEVAAGATRIVDLDLVTHVHFRGSPDGHWVGGGVEKSPMTVAWEPLMDDVEYELRVWRTLTPRECADQGYPKGTAKCFLRAMTKQTGVQLTLRPSGDSEYSYSIFAKHNGRRVGDASGGRFRIR